MTYQYGDEGIVRTALSGIDIAPWDLVAERHTVPVTELLGPISQDRTRYTQACIGWLAPKQSRETSTSLSMRAFGPSSCTSRIPFSYAVLRPTSAPMSH